MADALSLDKVSLSAGVLHVGVSELAERLVESSLSHGRSLEKSSGGSLDESG